MKTTAMLATAVLLFVIGCGSNTTTSDMQVVIDMSAGADMVKTGSCQSILACAGACTSSPNLAACFQTCAATGSTTAQHQFMALEQCLLKYCGLDGGIASIATCNSGVINKPDSQGGCATEKNACM